jgi:hypothetical protein
MLWILWGIDFVMYDGLDVDYSSDGISKRVLIPFELWCWTGRFWTRIFRRRWRRL